MGPSCRNLEFIQGLESTGSGWLGTPLRDSSLEVPLSCSRHCFDWCLAVRRHPRVTRTLIDRSAWLVEPFLLFPVHVLSCSKHVPRRVHRHRSRLPVARPCARSSSSRAACSIDFLMTLSQAQGLCDAQPHSLASRRGLGARSKQAARTALTNVFTFFTRRLKSSRPVSKRSFPHHTGPSTISTCIMKRLFMETRNTPASLRRHGAQRGYRSMLSPAHRNLLQEPNAKTGKGRGRKTRKAKINKPKASSVQREARRTGNRKKGKGKRAKGKRAKGQKGRGKGGKRGRRKGEGEMGKAKGERGKAKG